MLPSEHANGFGLTMACGEYGKNYAEPNSSTHKLYIFNNFIIIHTILRRHISIGMKWMVLFFLFPLPGSQPWEDIDLSSFSEEESHYCQRRIKCHSSMEIKAWGVVSCCNKVMHAKTLVASILLKWAWISWFATLDFINTELCWCHNETKA